MPPPAGMPDRTSCPRAPRCAAPSPTAATAARLRRQPAPRLPRTEPKAADPELEAKRKKAEAERRPRPRPIRRRVAALRADNCSRAKAQLTTLESGHSHGPDQCQTGEREYLDDKQRADEVQRTRKDVIAADCK